MNWKLKAVFGQILSAVPGGERAHAWVQRRITKSLPLPQADFDFRVNIAVQHLIAIHRHTSGAPLQEMRFFEFGAGWELAMPLIFWRAGVRQQVLFDLHRLVRPELVRDAAKRLSEHPLLKNIPAEIASGMRPLDSITIGDSSKSLQEILESVGIRYHAPADAAATALDPGHVHVVTSSLVLEHVPPESIAAIYKEMYRILASGGIMSHSIDMSDHYSHSDPNVTPWNFLTISERAWPRSNPPFLYQNRLRASEHLRLMTEAGFQVLEVTPHIGGSLEAYSAIEERLQPPFDRWHDPADLQVTHLHAVARKP